MTELNPLKVFYFTFIALKIYMLHTIPILGEGIYLLGMVVLVLGITFSA